jgi:rRNA maturation endonuclease Nob1
LQLPPKQADICNDPEIKLESDSAHQEASPSQGRVKLVEAAKPVYAHVEAISGKEPAELTQGWFREEQVCFKAVSLLRQDFSVARVAEILNISLLAVKKINFQLAHSGQVRTPREARP